MDACEAGLDAVQLDLGRQDPGDIAPRAQRFDLAPGTADSRAVVAMNRHQLDVALSAGRQAIERARLAGFGLIWAQGAGAGATLTNAAWEGWLHGFDGRLCLASDRALDAGSDSRAWRSVTTSAASPAARRHQGDSDAVARILRRHGKALSDPYEALRCLGGFEHAALVGSALAAAQLGLPWLALGASAQVALRLAVALNPSVVPWLEAARCGSGCRAAQTIMLGSEAGRPAPPVAH